MSVSFSPDGQTLAIGCYDGEVILWDVSTGQEKDSFIGIVDWEYGDLGIESVSFSPDGQTLACSGNMVRLWDVSGGRVREKAVLEGHVGGVRAVSFSPDGQTLASLGYEDTILLWDMVPYITPR